MWISTVGKSGFRLSPPANAAHKEFLSVRSMLCNQTRVSHEKVVT
jgi:hypothetical protein